MLELWIILCRAPQTEYGWIKICEIFSISKIREFVRNIWQIIEWAWRSNDVALRENIILWKSFCFYHPFIFYWPFYRSRFNKQSKSCDHYRKKVIYEDARLKMEKSQFLRFFYLHKYINWPVGFVMTEIINYLDYFWTI